MSHPEGYSPTKPDMLHRKVSLHKRLSTEGRHLLHLDGLQILRRQTHISQFYFSPVVHPIARPQLRARGPFCSRGNVWMLYGALYCTIPFPLVALHDLEGWIKSDRSASNMEKPFFQLMQLRQRQGRHGNGRRAPSGSAIGRADQLAVVSHGRLSSSATVRRESTVEAGLVTGPIYLQGNLPSPQGPQTT